MTDRKEIERLFKAHYPPLHRLALAMVHDDDSASDIVHDVFASLLSIHSRILPTPSYLIAAVRNRCLNHIRDLAIKDRVVNLYFCEIDEYDIEEFPDDETISRIYNIIKSELPPQCRKAMELRFYDGLTFSKVASVMGISENAVYKHVRQALVIIRNNLKENEA